MHTVQVELNSFLYSLYVYLCVGASMSCGIISFILAYLDLNQVKSDHRIFGCQDFTCHLSFSIIYSYN